MKLVVLRLCCLVVAAFMCVCVLHELLGQTAGTGVQADADKVFSVRTMEGLAIAGISTALAIDVLTLLTGKAGKDEKPSGTAATREECHEEAPAYRLWEEMVASAAYKHIREALKTGANPTDAEWDELAALVNTCYPGFREKLEELCQMSEADYRICLLLKAKLKLKDIAQLANLSLSGLASVRCKLYLRAFNKKGSARMWDSFIDAL